jgi:hypothetical protein
MMTPEEQKRHAKRLLQDEVMMGFIDDMERDAVERWSATALPDRENREIYYHQVQGIREMRERLRLLARDT